MRNFASVSFILFFLCSSLWNVNAQIKDGGEYYLYSMYYDCALGQKTDGTPGLSKFGINQDPDSYKFIAEKSETTGYYFLKQKSSGKYLAASTSNTYSVVFQPSKVVANQFLWNLNTEHNGTISSGRSPSNYLGHDLGKQQDTYISVFYDKKQNYFNLLQLISVDNAFENSLVVNDNYGKKVRYSLSLQNQQITLADQVDYHIINETNSLTNSTINLANENAWVIFDNTLPSDVITKYLTSFTINGTPAVLNQNVRVGIYLNGAVVIPHSSAIKAFSGYDGDNYTGNKIELQPGANELGAASNTFRSFKLKRGYMATLASGSNGSGYSRVYVADHSDIEVPVLPNSLHRRITSVHIKKWNYVSKKGWCSTTSNAAIATENKKMRSTWFYTWSADRSTTYDTEYIPIKQHLYWPSNSQINGHQNSTHVLSFNEPEHAEQHTSNICSCGGVISPWTACTKTPDFQSSGMRIGSPSPTDASWLTEYINHCDDMAYRCDFVVMHCYWGTNEAANATAWYNRLKAIYNATKRPIWITEWNNGASWTTESWPSGYGEKLEKNKNAIREILNMLDTCSFIERYSIYNWDSYYRAMINTDDGWVTPAGQVYRDNKSTFAYNADVQYIPTWWTPGLKPVELRTRINSASGKLEFTVKNTNGDLTEKMIIQRKTSNGTYLDFYSETNRSVFDSNEHTYTFDLNDVDLEVDEFRLYVKTTAGGETYSSETSLAYIVNPDIITNSTSAVDGWTCIKSAANGFTKATGDSYFEVWDATAKGMYFDYYQVITDLADGVYELSAACFNSSNGVAGDKVNGRVGLYAQSGGLEYFAPVTDDAELDTQNRQVIPRIIVENGTLRIGIKNIGEMTARWAGGDEFKLRHLGSVNDIITEGQDAFKEEITEQSDTRYKQLFVWNEGNTIADASGVVINPDCMRKDLYGWTATNVDSKSGEAFDGVTTNNYWDKWSSSAYTSAMYQDLDYLPEGTYTFSALVRCSSGAIVQLYASRDQGATKEVAVNFVGTGVLPPAGSPYLNGWNKVSLPSVVIRRGERLRIGLTSSLQNQWWSADHFTLSYEPLKVTGLTDLTLKDRSNYTVFVTSEHAGSIILRSAAPADVRIYTIAGKLVYHKLIDAGTTSVALPQGVYIINKRSN